MTSELFIRNKDDLYLYIDMNNISTTSHGARHNGGTAVADKLRSIIVRLGVLLIMNLPACRCVTYDQTEQPQQIECSITIGPKTLHLELLVQ